jgi:hypothetical protein
VDSIQIPTINSYKYPLKNQEDEVIIQLDKINQKPVLYLLKEMGLTDLEIYQNLHMLTSFISINLY